ncbi:MAG TPA: glycosyl hydrolase family 2 [Terriglobia bacterium]|nr:glycosyl hydrolase family 2 [Terriglobia bacterium]
MKELAYSVLMLALYAGGITFCKAEPHVRRAAPGFLSTALPVSPALPGAQNSKDPAATPGTRIKLAQDWMIQSSAKVGENGRVISTNSFHAQGWYLTTVPSTVLAALVRNRVYANPDYGMNLRSIRGTSYPIGGNFAMMPMPSNSPFRRGWWYRTQFFLPSSAGGKQLWLHFHGINNSANVWLNGHQVATSDQISGMYRQYEFNITTEALPGAMNTLAVEVFAPTPHDLSITFVDWLPLPPDKDMGIYRSVFVTSSGSVTVRDLQATTHFDLPLLTVAHLTVSARLTNATDRPVEGVLRARIGPISLSQRVHLEGRESKRLVFAPQAYRQLNIFHPRVWWPYLYGPQDLYDLDVEFETGGEVSDRQNVQFGIREITSELDSQNHRIFSINGHRVLIRGAGWAPDMMLRWSAAKEAAQLLYVRDMHLNTVRLEGKLMDDQFYELCDRYGILVMAGWCCCSHWERWRSWKESDYTIAGDSLRDQMRRLRNHPCMLVWLYGSDGAPPPRAEAVYLNVLKNEHWPNPYIASASSRKTVGAGWTGVKMTGPYQYVGPSYWELDTQHGGAFGFNTETSPGPAIPLLASLKQMFPPEDLWPINTAWDDHTGGGVFGNLDVYNHALNARYGKPGNLDDYVEKAQVTDYEGERAMFEAYGRNKYTSTGVIQWMLNSGWPSLIWNLYDYYLRPGGGYYGTKKACEPLHVQYSYDDHSIVVVNSYESSFQNYTVTAELLNLDTTRKFFKKAVINIPPDSSNRVLTLPDVQGLSRTYFVRLMLRGSSGRVVSRNFYWLSTHPDTFDWDSSTWYYTPLQSFADFKGLQRLPKVRLSVTSRVGAEGDESIDRVTLKNPSRNLAFFVHIEVLKGQGGEDVHPILWQDNDFELAPGEQREVTARYATAELNGARPVVSVGGWNVAPSLSPNGGT